MESSPDVGEVDVHLYLLPDGGGDHGRDAGVALVAAQRVGIAAALLTEEGYSEVHVFLPFEVA